MPSRALVTTVFTSPDCVTFRRPARGSTLASLASLAAHALTLSALIVGSPSAPSVTGMLIHETLRATDALCVSSPSETATGVLASALALSATACASSVVTSGTASVNSTTVLAEVRSRAAAPTAPWKVLSTTVLPATAGTTTNDFLSLASFTVASTPMPPESLTRSAMTTSVAAGSVVTTASTSRLDIRDVAYVDQVRLAKTASTVASTVASTSTA